MNEKKKMYIIIGFVAIMVAFIPFTAYVNHVKGEKIVKAVENLVGEKGTNIIFLGKDDCPACQQFSPVLNSVTQENELEYHYVNINKVDNNQLDRILKMIAFTEESLSVPYLIVVKDGKTVEKQIGYIEEDELIEFFQKSGLLEGYEPPKDLTVSFDKFKQLYESKDRTVLVHGASWCGNCQNLMKMITKMQKEETFEASFLYVDKIDSKQQDDYKEFASDIQKIDCGYPLSLIVEDGKIIDSFCGATSADKYRAFLVKNEILKD